MARIKTKIFTIPNILSILRLPFALIIILVPNKTLAVGLLFFTLFLDILDGYLARRWKQVSRLGAILDAVFDRLFVFIIFVFYFIKLELAIPFLVMFMLRDITTSLMGLTAIILKFNTKVLKAQISGKITTLFQVVCLAFMIMEQIDFVKYSLYATFVVSVVASIDYLLYVKHNWKKI
ncbi:CDP-alcohol phosphatidyltransferase family protein [Patescibacteria group bacterium]